MCYVWTAPSWQGLRSLGPAVRLTARPPVRLFHLVFEPHDGRALVPIPKRSASPRSDINTAAVDSLKALDPKRPIREATVERTFQNRRFVPLTTKVRRSKRGLFDHSSQRIAAAAHAASR